MKEPQTTLDEIGLRRITPDDEPFLFQVYASTRALETSFVPWTDAQKQDFLQMQFRAQHQFYHGEYPDAEYQIITWRGEDVGRLYVDRREADIRILDVTVLPEYRNRGIGALLIQELTAEAATSRKPVSAYVDNLGGAGRLFERLGFSPAENDGVNTLFVHNPPASGK